MLELNAICTGGCLYESMSWLSVSGHSISVCCQCTRRHLLALDCLEPVEGGQRQPKLYGKRGQFC